MGEPLLYPSGVFQKTLPRSHVAETSLLKVREGLAEDFSHHTHAHMGTVTL